MKAKAEADTLIIYMPQIWTSDNSDAISRLRIQYGTSIVHPWSSIAAHVSVVPNHQVHRVTPFRTRGEIAFTGAVGYELDLSALADEDREEVKRQIGFYKQWRSLLQKGDLYVCVVLLTRPRLRGWSCRIRRKPS